MRVGELTALEWRDVDVAGNRFRIRRVKTAAARRRVAVPAWLGHWKKSLTLDNYSHVLIDEGR
jgi:integrase